MIRRHALAGLEVRDAQHQGLAFRYLLDSHDPTASQHPYHRHVQQVAAIHPGRRDPYAAAYERWSHAVDGWGGTIRLEAVTTSPLAIGLGTASPIEVGITLHHTYGVPYLPGSAIKGVARRAAADHDLDAETTRILFGESDEKQPAYAGYAIFWDGWLVPSVTSLQSDVITVHSSKYYQSEGTTPPTDFDDPNPVPFLSVPTGTRFQLAVSCADAPDWALTAAELVKYGLENLGIGGKTNVGYGMAAVTLNHID